MGVAVVALSVVASEAKAEEAWTIEGEVRASSSYVSGTPFYDRFSEHPQAQLTLGASLGPVYAEIYGYADLEQGGFRGDASERGFEVGYTKSLGENTEFTLAGGRFENYNGGGSDAGDWFAQPQFSYREWNVSVMALWNDDGSYAILTTSYSWELGEQVVIEPGLSYYTDDRRVHFGVEGEWSITDNFALTGALVFPEVEDELGRQKRETYGAAGAAWRF